MRETWKTSRDRFSPQSFPAVCHTRVGLRACGRPLVAMVVGWERLTIAGVSQEALYHVLFFRALTAKIVPFIHFYPISCSRSSVSFQDFFPYPHNVCLVSRFVKVHIFVHFFLSFCSLFLRRRFVSPSTHLCVCVWGVTFAPFPSYFFTKWIWCTGVSITVFLEMGHCTSVGGEKTHTPSTLCDLDGYAASITVAPLLFLSFHSQKERSVIIVRASFEDV